MGDKGFLNDISILLLKSLNGDIKLKHHPFQGLTLQSFVLSPELKNVLQGLYSVTVAHNALGAPTSFTRVCATLLHS